MYLHGRIVATNLALLSAAPPVTGRTCTGSRGASIQSPPSRACKALLERDRWLVLVAQLQGGSGVAWEISRACRCAQISGGDSSIPSKAAIESPRPDLCIVVRFPVFGPVVKGRQDRLEGVPTLGHFAVCQSAAERTQRLEYAVQWRRIW